MNFNKNCFPIIIDSEEAISIFNKELSSKGYSTKITKEQIRLNVFPYWVCFYDIDYVSDNNKKYISGQTALNATKNIIEDEILDLFQISNPKIINQIKIKDIEKIEIKIKNLIVSEEESKITITKKLENKLLAEKINVDLSGFDEIWVSFWKTTIDKKDYYFDATGNKINNFKEIKKKQKTNKQLFNEMISEIQNPSKLMGYFKGMFAYVGDFFKFLYRNKSIVLILLLIIILVLLII